MTPEQLAAQWGAKVHGPTPFPSPGSSGQSTRKSERPARTKAADQEATAPSEAPPPVDYARLTPDSSNIQTMAGAGLSSVSPAMAWSDEVDAANDGDSGVSLDALAGFASNYASGR